MRRNDMGLLHCYNGLILNIKTIICALAKKSDKNRYNIRLLIFINRDVFSYEIGIRTCL